MDFKFLFVFALVLAMTYAFPKRDVEKKDKKPDFPNGNDRACRGPTYYPCTTSCTEIGYSDGVCKVLYGKKRCICVDYEYDAKKH